MKTEEIMAMAAELDCHPGTTAVTLARAVAERCATYAGSCAEGSSASDAATRIRLAFGLAS